MTSDPVRLHSIESAAVVVTPWTEWTFARLWAVSGASGDVEITTAGDVARLVAEQVDVLKGAAIAGEADVPRMLGVDERRLSGDLPLATAVSALRTGVSIIQAVEDGITLAEALGGEPSGSVPLYANVNRGLFATQRTPADFAEAAELAVGEGFRAVKCAPFDEVNSDYGSGEAVRQARFGIRRVAAIRDTVGPNVTLMVDCHGRFGIESAVIVAEELAELGVGWFEEPVRPNVTPMGFGADCRVCADDRGRRRDRIRRGALREPDRECCGQGHHAGRDVLRRRGCGRAVRHGGNRCRGRSISPQSFGTGLVAHRRTRHRVYVGCDALGARCPRGGLARGPAHPTGAGPRRSPAPHSLCRARRGVELGPAEADWAGVGSFMTRARH